MESSDSIIDSENEVKKLQELVKKLEKQNELLRGKQKFGLEQNGDVEKSLTQNNNHQAESPLDSVTEGVGERGLEDVEVLDIDNLSLKDEEDSWLYSSPKPPTAQQTNINVYKWVRQDFDHPSPEMESARRTLLSKLDEAARMNRSSSTPALGSTTSLTKSVSSLSRSTEESQKPFSRPHQKQSLLSMSGNRIDNGTFSRPRKSNDRHVPVMSEKERGDEMCRRHEGTDVETLAKQQEESLRQSMATYTSPKRVLHNKSMSIASDNDNSPLGSNRSSPARYDYEGSFMNHHRNSFGSDSGTPPDSPRTVQHPSIPHTGSTCRGGGNMSCLQYPQPSSHSSDSSLEHLSAGSMDDLHLTPETRPNNSWRLPAPGFWSASPATGGLRPGLTSTQGVTPQRSGLPTPRRGGIPRPASSSVRSSLPTPRRSGIPSPRNHSGHTQDESWRDGCF